VEESATNAGGTGGPVASSATAVVLIEAPKNTVPPTITGTAQQGQTLTEHNGTWTNNPTSFAYKWQQCNSSGASCAPISGATSQTYVPVAGDVGHTLKVQETASNSGGPGGPAKSVPTAVVVPPVPTNTSPPTISGTAQQGQTLTEVHGSWTNEPTSFGYQWLRCDSSGASCAPISGATGQTYVPVAEDVGHTLRVQETASNSGGSSSPAESPATAVVNAAPPASFAPPATASALTLPLSPNLQPAPGDPPAEPPTRVVISTRSVTITARGDALIEVSCPANARGGCHGRITIRLAEAHARGARALAARCARGCRSLGSANYEARAGQKTRVRVHLSSYGRRLLVRRKALRVTVTATNVSGGQTATMVRTITLRAHRRAA
jgi:hypothetical protein